MVHLKPKPGPPVSPGRDTRGERGRSFGHRLMPGSSRQATLLTRRRKIASSFAPALDIRHPSIIAFCGHLMLAATSGQHGAGFHARRTGKGHLMTNDWWRGSVTYQVYPRSFQDSDADGIGDLPGITRRLQYIAGLGVDAVWLSPVFASPMADMGYDVSDYTDIDPLFGTLSDFDAMVSRAHEHGLKVIIDQVLAIPRISTRSLSKAAGIGTIRRPTGMSGPMPGPTARRRTTGHRSSAARPGNGTGIASSITCTIS